MKVYEFNEMYLLKIEFSALQLSCMSLVLTDMWWPSAQQCHEELCLIFVQLIIYIASILLAPSFHTSTHQHSCSPCAQTFVPKEKEEMEQETRFDTDSAAICRMNSEPFLLQLLVWLTICIFQCRYLLRKYLMRIQ